MGGASTVRVEDQLCFAVYAASNAVVRTYRPLLRDLGLTYPQYLALMVLWEDDGLSVRQVADRLQLPANALTPLLVRLEQLGFLSRVRDPRDGRIVRARLTSAGRRLEVRAAAVQQQVVCRTGLDDVSLAALRTQLRSLADHMAASASLKDPIEGDTA
ncbi:MarR family winged helix-turn-helix transcriptional regulator [Nocardioides sp. AX2bis]|uniref:MarR family winged helix-turn-helix transcriptional regulator n=1 Tax=Nocardioides sp. AX2bis TaxID=2653157 RepID=UPI0012F3F080|nr:MarR family transcriptional regulator [Nocardioides sp. AX2bis]VXC15469.1 Organic hydroperoxide resistance transcriptional regulator [Nocardioides sp. AX2bis]